MSNLTNTLDVPQSAITENVACALKEDIGSGDITAMLIEEDKTASAQVITREDCVLCGVDWVNEVIKQTSEQLSIQWHAQDGDKLKANDLIFTLNGPARAILTAERTALNFLQTLSGTATKSDYYANLVAHTNVKLLDTRKTLPGLRLAQKYAVSCGGCHNHRIGLYDAFLIKENHIISCGSIAQSIAKARSIDANKPVEIEVESMDELKQALDAKADIIMLDNFSLPQLNEAIELNQGQAKLEASGGITNITLVPIAETGVDFISIGTLTKDCHSIDLSMRVTL